MRRLKIRVLLFFVAGLLLPVTLSGSVLNRPAQSREDRFRHRGEVDNEGEDGSGNNANVSEAPTGFDNQTNGFDDQGMPPENMRGTAPRRASRNGHAQVQRAVDRAEESTACRSRFALKTTPMERRELAGGATTG